MQEAAGDNDFMNTIYATAYTFSEYFAAKATLSVLDGTEWLQLIHEYLKRELCTEIDYQTSTTMVECVW